jgi:hypothetical protein
LTDSTTTSIKAVPASQPYGNEAATSFTVTVTTGGGEVLPFAGETATVNVGSATCLAPLTPGGAGGSGICSIANTALPTGPYPASGTYGGDADLSASRSALVVFTVSQGTSKTTLKLSKATVTYGDEQVGQLRVRVMPEFAGTVPTSSVTLTTTTTTVCVITLAAGAGTCTLSADQLAVGAYTVVATYGGDQNFRGSTSAAKTLTVT